MKKLREVYLDNNATTRVDERVIRYMNKFFRNDYAVASSQFSHAPGIRAKEGIDLARHIISKRINCDVEELVFTSGATESNNLAIKGLAMSNQDSKRNKIIISGVEHFSVLQSAQSLEKSGFKVETVNVNNQGFVDIESLKKLVDEKTLLVSIIAGNNEVGTVQDIKSIAEISHKVGAIFHTDAAVLFMQGQIDVQEQEIDMMSITAHKIYGPKGVGALYVKRGTKIEKIIDGGYQEFNFRSGTENVSGIAGFGKAVEIYSDEETKKIRSLRDYLYEQIKNNISEVELNGAEDFNKRIPNNLNVSFKYIEGESVVLHLDMRGIAVVTGSACFSRALQASHILLAMGFSHERAHGSIRFSLSKYNTKDDIDYTVNQLKEVVENLRNLSPIKEV